MTYSFETPIYQQQKKIDNDWIKIDYINLKYWHFIQFEYGRTSKPDDSPPIYNSLLTVILPYQSRQDNINWKRDNHHFTGVPIYFYLGGSLSQHENKFIGSISQFKFISQYTLDLQSIDLQSSIQCHYTCFTCTGPTSSDCSTCFAEKNRVYSANQCVCQIGYMNKDPALLDTLCELPSQKYKMIQFKETEYKCPEGYDQCEDKIVCSFGYFKVEQNCYLCPQQHSEQLQDIIFCSDCVLKPKSWGFNLQCRDNILKIDSAIFSVASTDTYEYRYNTNNNSLEIDTITYTISLGCEKGYALDNEFKCIKCQNCIRCQYDRDTQKCLECPKYYYLQLGNCIECGINCEQCDSKGCLQCQQGSFLTLDKFNCNECSIQNCDYCYQYYQNSISNEIAISLDLKFNQVDLSLNGIVISCARCGYGFTISGNTCIEQQLSSGCLTGIIENNKFQCLIGFDENTGLQFNNCNLIENCNSCFVKYPINPWCIQCVEGYYVLFEDGTCASCPDICLSCLRQNSAYKDQWKIRAFYNYKFGSHLFEDFAIDTENYQYNVACTWCKDDYILFENICIPGCGQNCEVCEVQEGKALCTKCKDNQYGPVFLDNEFNLPVKCENSQKCFKSLILQLDVYCSQDFEKNISNCLIDNIQQCLVDIFNQEMIDYMKKQVIKELEINLNIQDQLCKIGNIEITQFISKLVMSLKKTTLKLSSLNQTVLEFTNSMMQLNSFSHYVISNLIMKQVNQSEISIFGPQITNITLEQIIIMIKGPLLFRFLFFGNVSILVLKDFIIEDFGQRGQDLFEIDNLHLQNVYVSIIGLQILNSISQTESSRYFQIVSYGDIQLMLTNISIKKSEFEKGFSFMVITGQPFFKVIIKNLLIENNIFSDCSFIKFENVYELMYISMTLKNNSLNNSILFQIPIVTLENSIFLENKLYNSSIFIKSFGSFLNFSESFGYYINFPVQFNFIKLVTLRNEYCLGCQFISINQQDDQNISVYFENYSSVNNQEKDLMNMKLNYEKSLIFIKSNYVFLNYFTIERLNGTIELSIMQTQQIIIKNLTIQNNKINKIITQQSSCLSNSLNLVMYILDTQYLSIDTFIINQLSAIDYSIIAIQSQSILRKEQNETIILKNGQIFNNSLIISQLNSQVSVIQINSQQKQQIDIDNIRFVKNILNLYVQDLQMFSAATVLIQSDKGKIQIQNCYFQQNYAINSTNSQLSIQGNSIQISDTIFLNNNIFDLEVLKNFLILDYNGKISIEQIKLKDYPIQSNGGSGQLTASTIIIDSINIHESFGGNGGSFYIQTLGVSYIKISDSVIMYSYTSDDVNSSGGTFHIDGSKSNLQLILQNIQIQYSKSRKTGGCIYLNALQLTTQITNISCTNCFSINGGFMMMDSRQEYPTSISLTRITLQNPDFRWFLENTIDMTSEEQMLFRKNSYLLYLPNSILKVDQLEITDGDYYGILYIDGKNGIVIQGMVIQEYRAFLTPLITISHSQITQKQIYLANIQIKDINQGKFKQYVCNNSLIQKEFYDFDSNNDCSKGNSINIQEILTLFDQLYKDNNFNCNYLNIHQTSEQQTAMIEVINLTSNLITIENIYINNVSYQAAYGLISLRDFSQIVNQIKIYNLNIINSYCGNGCMLVSSSTSNLINKKRLLVNNMQEIIKSSNSSVIIYNSKFINNQAIQGSGIYIINVSTMIINTQFINNTAKNLGGAIYFTGNINNLLLLNNEIISNKAENQSGSGVYLKDITMSNLNGLQNIFIDNQQDLNEIPQRLQLLSNKVILNKLITKSDSQVFIEQVYVRPYKLLGYKQLTDVLTLPSGQSIKDYQYFDQFNQQYIPYNLSLRFIPINSFRQQLYDQRINLQLSARTGNNNFSNKYFNKNIFIYDNTTQSFNLDDLIIYYSPYEQSNLEVKVESTDIKIPKYSQIPPYNIESYQNYELRFLIKTFPCQLGQFYDINLQGCQQCTGNTYSVQLNSTICVFKDDNFINQVNSAMIQLKAGYWRAYVYSPLVDPCYHLQENCIGGWGTGNQLCSQGHIGAFCEQCDLYNIRGYGQFSISSLYSCGSCSLLSRNIISVFLISVWTLISIVISVQSTIEYIDDHIKKGKFIKLGLSLPDQKTNPAIIIKVLSNYLQIIVTIATFQLQVPPGIASVFNSVGNPINQMAYSLDCFLIGFSKINIIYFRIIWSLVIAFSYISTYQLGYLLLVLTKKTIFNVSAVTTCFIYVYVYLQPNLISSLIQLVSIRYISGQSWIAGNVSYRYDTKTHTIWLLSFVIPLLVVIGLIIPIILWFGIFKNRKHLHFTKVKSIWGYLYNEYKLSSFYWETIKISQKEFIIVVLAYYEDYIPIKAALVFICLFFYSQFTNIKKPYNQGMFNKLDAQQTTICAVSIILATTIYTAQQYNLSEIIWPFYLIISLLNLIFVLKLLGILIYAYGQAFETQLDQIRDTITYKYPRLMNRNRFFKKILENQEHRKKRINLRFMQIKNYLLPKAQLIIQFKKNNMIVQKPQKLSYIRQTQLNDDINSPQTYNMRLNVQ